MIFKIALTPDELSFVLDVLQLHKAKGLEKHALTLRKRIETQKGQQIRAHERVKARRVKAAALKKRQALRGAKKRPEETFEVLFRSEYANEKPIDLCQGHVIEKGNG